jgi:hypothetical protein
VGSSRTINSVRNYHSAQTGEASCYTQTCARQIRSHVAGTSYEAREEKIDSRHIDLLGTDAAAVKVPASSD